MNRKILSSLVIVMGFVFLILFVFHYFWVIQAFNNNKKAFEQAVLQGMHKISKTLETKETVVQINSEAFSIGELSQQDYLKYIDSILNLQNNPKVYSQNSFSKQTIILSDTSFNRTEDAMDNLNQRQPESDVNLSILRNEISKKISKKTLFVEKVVNKLLNYDEDIAVRIDTSKLEEMIAQTFKDEEIDIPFQFAVYKDDSIIKVRSSEYTASCEIENFCVKLFPNDVFNSGLVLNVYFPDQRHYIIKKILPISILSVFLVFSIFLIFSYTYYLIIKQKRLSIIKTDFINNMTHELKTPISTITIASSLINEKIKNTEQENISKFTKIISDESSRLNLQVENVLKIAMLQEGKVKLKMVKFDINKLITDVAKNFQILFEQQHGKIELISNNESHLITGDEFNLESVFANLLDNALKYSKKNPTVKISIKSEYDSVKISVKDNGIGIEKKQLKKIFEKFYRIPTGNVHDVKGFGIGLSFVKDIIVEHSGEINVKSEVGKGTEFVIKLPQKKSII